jgi:hypothetical protein
VPEIFVIHRHDPRNIGDMWSAPTQFVEYFPWLANATTIDIEFDIPQYADRLRNAHVINGGDLIDTAFLRPEAEPADVAEAGKAGSVVAGHNNNGMRHTPTSSIPNALTSAVHRTSHTLKPFTTFGIRPGLTR